MDLYPKLDGHEGIDWGCCASTPDLRHGPRLRHTEAWSKGGGRFKEEEKKLPAYGNSVNIWTRKGSGREYELTYARLATVRVGRTAARGEGIGVSGNTGYSTEPHLHVRYRPVGYQYANRFTDGEDFRAYLDMDIYDWPGITDLWERLDRHTSDDKRGLNVRSGPGPNHRRVGSIAKDSTIRYDTLGKDTATPIRRRIGFTADDQRATGWVHGNYVQTHNVEHDPPNMPIAPQLGRKNGIAQGIVRAHPEPTAVVEGSLAVSEAIVTYYEIVGKDADSPAWWQIRFSRRRADSVEGIIGWVHTEHAQTRGDLESVPLTGPVRLRLKARAVVRRGPGVHQAVVPSGDRAADADYDIVGRDAPDPSWWQIRIGDGTGWVQAAHVDMIQGDTDDVPIRDDQGPPGLTLKQGSKNDPVTLHAGPSENYHWEATGYAPHREPDYAYPIVGRRGAWWQILYHAPLHSPLWVHRDDVEVFKGNQDEAVETWPWVRAERNEQDLRGRYEAHLDENAQMRFILAIKLRGDVQHGGRTGDVAAGLDAKPRAVGDNLRAHSGMAAGTDSASVPAGESRLGGTGGHAGEAGATAQPSGSLGQDLGSVTGSRGATAVPGEVGGRSISTAISAGCIRTWWTHTIRRGRRGCGTRTCAGRQGRWN